MRAKGLRTLAALLALSVYVGTAWAADPLLEQIESEFIRIGEQLRKIVVNIDVKGSIPEGIDGSQMEGLEEFFRYFGMPIPDPGQGQRGPLARPQASGSGFIYDSRGYIITNNHVVEDAIEVKVHLWNGEVYDAEVVGRDPQTDIAVIKIDAGVDLPAAELGDSDALRVGQFAIAVGNPRRLQGSLSYGHVTALGREGLQLPGLRFQNLIQTDAAINLGNSGGPLCDIDGRVIGINTAIVFGADALGFAVPINTAKKVIPTLISEGKVTRGYLGVDIRDAAEVAEAVGLPDDNGAFVERVRPNTPAAAAGMQVYDVVRKVNGEAVKDSQGLVNRISDLPPGATVVLEVWRDNKAVEVDVKLEEFPDSLEVAARGKDVLGLRVQPLTPELIERLGVEAGTQGVLVTGIEPGSVAAEAGMRQGDIIIEIAKQPVTDVDKFHELMQAHAVPGKPLLLRTVRGSNPPRVVVIDVPEETQTR